MKDAPDYGKVELDLKISDIRTVSKDDKIGTAVCRANISQSVYFTRLKETDQFQKIVIGGLYTPDQAPVGQKKLLFEIAPKEYTYKIEKTSEGRLYVSLRRQD